MRQYTFVNILVAGHVRNGRIITSTQSLRRLVRGFRSTVHQIATGLAGGGVSDGNARREVISVPFLNIVPMMIRRVIYHDDITT